MATRLVFAAVVTLTRAPNDWDHFEMPTKAWRVSYARISSTGTARRFVGEPPRA